MKTSRFILAVLFCLAPMAGHGAVLAHESFNYTPGADVLTLQNTATGFSDV